MFERRTPSGAMLRAQASLELAKFRSRPRGAQTPVDKDPASKRYGSGASSRHPGVVLSEVFMRWKETALCRPRGARR